MGIPGVTGGLSNHKELTKMKIKDFMQALYDFTDNAPENYKTTCDMLKIGEPEAEMTKVATTMFATAEVIRQAAAWGANLLIVHEPTFYNHFDRPEELDQSPEYILDVINAKRDFIRKHGMTIYRFHDHPHHRCPDMISEGQVKFWGLTGQWKKGKYFGINDFALDKPMSVLEIARTLENSLGIKHIRICGARETQVKQIGLCFGTPGHLEEELSNNDLVVTGEICEWAHGEYVRDLVEICGQRKSLLVLGHIPSEAQGMKLLAEFIQQHWPTIEARFFETPEAYTYVS